ncbi:stage II sporulation protein P [Pseudoflavonifractor phocaeensis]|uniref:stage II sporulation protein P n=1 Tax=Pseudoflavonifractor phocaeensis TaxID=1870988 RepID=UPI001F241867|nr:stage II sporulation protein P [Pseudoflavonifractor phocaeensis]MCF2596268.1 stage II sporulation protein P [Pseudoflavonifractor phocaeensis]
MRESRRYLTALRRGVALGLVLAALWGAGQLAGFSGLGDRLASLGRAPGLTRALLARQLGPLPGERTDALEGWGRLLLGQSPLLAAGEEEVLRLREGGGGSQDASDPAVRDEDSDDQEEPQLRPQTGEDGVVEMTARGKAEGKYLYSQGVYLYNRTDFDLDASVLAQGTVDVALGEGPQILIVHTHGSESYAQTDGDAYEESDPYRTTDCTHNVVKVGEEMATVFRAHGFQVIHDTTLFDYPAYNGAYDRSKAAVEQWLAQYPTIKIVLDVHRDALVGSGGEVYKLVSEEAGKKVAQVMLVVGTSGSGAEHPRWKDNLAFAVKLQQGLTRGYDSLARPIVLRNSRYNQQLSPGSLLVEVGGHGNTLTEAVDGARLWADNVARTLLAMKAG